MNYLGFWEKIKKPIFILAPMADVTDSVFRQIITKYGKPDVFWTEFVSADGLCSLGREKLLVDLQYKENERPIVAQIFGAKLYNIKEATALCKELNFDGIDLNMGCPDKSIEKQGAGAAMIKNPALARAIIRVAKEGAGGLPVSVKTRIGYNKNEIETWIRELLAEDIAALTVHLRTRKEMSNVPARWDVMKRIVEIRDEMKKETLIFGNGDVVDISEVEKKCEETGCDGVMLGRAVFGNPWLFANLACAKRNCQIEHPASYSLEKKFQNKKEDKNESSFATQSRNSAELSECVAVDETHEYGAGVKCSFHGPSLKEKLKVMVEHTKLFEKELGMHKNFAIMKKHFKAYVNGFDGAKELRMKLMEAKDSKEIEKITNDFLTHFH